MVKRTKRGREVMENVCLLIKLFEPVHQKKLAGYMKMSERNIREVVSKLREDHIPIGFGNDGYFIGKSMEDLRHTLNILKCKNISTVNLMYNLEVGVDEARKAEVV